MTNRPKEGVAKAPIVLIVDDTPENLDILKESLAGEYVVRPAPSGPIALKAAAVLPHPDIILLDIMMPDMDGFEVLQRLKMDAATRDIPVIFITAKSEIEDELKGLRLGAVDYITKPFSIPIVQARVKTHLALKEANRKLDEKNQLLLDERELIENIVLNMRQADVLDERNLRHLVSPVETTAGDILLSTFTPDGRQLILLGDFTGHGLPAAIGGPLVTYIFHELAAKSHSGAEIIQTINTQLCNRLPVGIFFACVFVEVTPTRSEARIWNAALPDALIMRDGQISERLSSSLLPLGVIQELDFEKSRALCAMQDGDLLYAYSDGIVEEKNPSGEMFGSQRLEPFLIRLASGDGIPGDLTALLDVYAGTQEHEDDITLVEVTI